MKRYIILFIISTLIASLLLQCEKQENIDYSKELRWTTYTTSDGLAGNYVESIAIDKEGNKWFGTDGGVSKFDDNTWTIYTTSDGLVSNYVQKISIDNEGNKWFLSHKEISKFDGNTWTNYTISDFLVSNAFFYTIAIDKAGNKWFGTNMGVLKFDGNTWINYTISDGLVSNYVYTIAVDRKGNMWFGTNEGVSNFDGNAWKNYMNSDGISLNNVYRIAGDKKGNMWFLTEISNGCVSKFDGRKWTNYKFPTSSESFCEFSFSDKHEYCTIATIDAQDNLWVVRGFEHYESGCGGDICPSWYWNNIIFFDGKKWTTVYGDCPSENQFNFSSFAIDKENNKWFGTNNGVKKLSN